MSLVSFTLILSGVMLNTAAQLLLKAGTNAVGSFEFSLVNVIPIGRRLLTEPTILIALACYAFGVIVWILALSRVQVSVAYPMLSMGYVVSAIAAWWLLGEGLSVTKLVGIGIVILGVVVISSDQR